MRKLLLLFIIFLSSFSQLSAQFCLAPTSTLAIVPNGTIQYTPYYTTGARVFSFTGTAGCVYTFSTCGQSTNDTYLRLHNAALTLLVAADDQCGLQSNIVWTCPATGTYYIHLSRFVCAGLTSSTRMSYTVSCPTPCTQTSVTLNMFDSWGDGWNGAIYTLTNSAGTAVASGTLPTGSFGTATLCLAPGCYYMNVTGGTYPWECSWNLSVAGGTVANGGAPATNIVVPVGVSSCTVPNPPTSISATAQTICLGGSTTLTANGPVGTVYWFAGGCNTTGQIGTGNSITVSPTVTTTYYARNFQNGNFSNTCVSYTVIVNNSTTPTFNALPNICSGTTAPVLPSSSVNSINGTWNPANISTVAAGTTNYVFTPNAGQCAVAATVAVTVNPSPTMAITPTPAGCATVSNGALNVTATGGLAAYNVSWTGTSSGNPAGTEIAASGGSYAISNLAAGTYNVTLAGSNSCLATANATISSLPAIITTATPTALTCNGLSNGSISVSATNGTAPYNVSWTGPSSGNPSGTEIAAAGASYSIPTLGAGVYSITVTDAVGCISTISATVTEPTPLTSTFTQVNVLCFGNSSASINLTPTGGTAPYNYLWSNNATTEDLANLASGTYSITITDANGCTSPNSVTITQPTAALSLTETHTNVLCFGNTTGAIDLIPAGGTAPYTYLWSNNATTEDLNNITSGTYSVTTTDANGCAATLIVTITQPVAGMNLTETHSNVLCFGASTASIDQTVTGGTAPYTYLWSNNATTEDLTNIASGTYTVTTTDAAGCSSILNVIITQPTAALSLTETHTNVLCFGNTTGGIDLIPSGGTAPYTYLWSNNATTEDIANIASGTYTVTTTDANGCTATLSVTITQPTAALSLTETHTNVLCFGNSTGGVNLTSAGGTAPYTYLWSNNATTEDLNNIASGTYSVTTTDANGCTATLSVTITQPIAGLSLTETHTNVLCFGASTASIDQTVAGGTGPYTYLWSNTATTEDIANVASGTYTVTTTDANGCTATLSVIITQPTAALSLTETHTNVLCFGNTTGGIDLIPAGGTAPYTYLWSNNATTEDLSNIASGTYTVTTTDANGCTAILSVTITQPTAGLSLTETHTNVLCFGASTASIDQTVAGGTGPYTYLWSNNATPEDIANLASGTYSVTTTDASGCTATLSVTITQPQTGINLSETHTNVLCFGNATAGINQTVTGGTAPYTYLWSNTATTEDLTNIASGTYTVTTTDAAGCTATLSITITQPATGLSLAEIHTNVLCFGNSTGGVNLTPTGGTGPYTYLWSNNATTEDLANIASGTYTVTTTDANGCTSTLSVTITQPAAALSLTETHTNVLCFGASTASIDQTVTGGTSPYTYLWSNNATIEDIANLASGTYSVITTDASGCTATLSVTITQPQTGITLTETHTNVLCFGNATAGINQAVTGGTGPYTYLWSNTATTEDLANIPYGTYSVTTTDANGCTATLSVTITQPAAALSMVSTIQNVVCVNGTGSVDLTVSGGTPNYTYLWSNNATTQDLLAVISGLYTVTVTDANGCTATFNSTVAQAVSSTPVQINNQTGTNILSCLTTAIVLQGTGGTNYTWNAGSTPNSATNTFIAPGTYTLSTFDSNNCPVTVSVSITQNISLPVITITSNSGGLALDCNNSSISVTANGASQYAWSGGLGNNTNTTISSVGTYSVVGTGANGCIDSAAITITLAPSPSVTINDTSICNGQSLILAPTFFPAGGSIIWSNALPTPTISVSPNVTTTYSVLYTWNGCTVSEDILVTVNPTPTVIVNNPTICLGDQALITATPNLLGGTYLWSGAQTTNTISVSPVQNNTNYSVVYSLNGCVSQNATAVVTVNPIPTVNVLPVTICNGQSGNLVATPNLPGGNFLWINGGEITNSITSSPTTTTTYPVIYTLNGCPSLQATGTLNVNPLPIASMLADTLSGCAPLTVSFEADTTNQQATYQWASNSGGSGNGATSMMTFTNGGCYNITLTATMNGCVSSATNLNYICVEALPVAEFSTSISHFSESSQSMNFINSSSGASSYIWSFGDGSSSAIESPTHLFANTTSGYTIMLTAISSLGCADSTLVTIDYQEDEVFYIPNSFTPDGDKFNQVFLPIFTAGIDPYNYMMEIYNRWGEVIFETHNMEYGWDGSYGLEGNDCPSGSYTYRIVIKMPDIDERKILVGHVNLIR